MVQEASKGEEANRVARYVTHLIAVPVFYFPFSLPPFTIALRLPLCGPACPCGCWSFCFDLFLLVAYTANCWLPLKQEVTPQAGDAGVPMVFMVLCRLVYCVEVSGGLPTFWFMILLFSWFLALC